MPFWALHASQREALRQIIDALRESVYDVRLHTRLVKEGGTRDAREDLLVDRFRSTRLMFLDGARGTGKTSVYLSLLDSIGPLRGNSTVPPVEREGGSATPPRRSDEASREDLDELYGQTIWLEPLDMEPLPPHTNLITAVIARLLKAAERFLGSGYAECGPLAALARGSAGDPLADLVAIGSELSIGWEGEGRERSSRVDPDTYAAEAIRTERARLPVNLGFQRCLDDLARRIAACARLDENLVFVLPIDDFDLNPNRALDLMRFLRMLSARRLFFLVLGDRDLTEMVFALKIAGDLASLIEHSRYREHIPVPGEDVGGMARQIAANAVRKLLPPHQIVRLRNLEINDALEFRPWPGHSDAARDRETLGELLRKAKLRLELDGAHGPSMGKGPTSLKEFLDGSFSGLRGFRYSGAGLLRAPVRHITDLWFEFDRLVNGANHDSDPAVETFHSRLAELFARLLQSTIIEDQRLTLRGREELLGAVNCDAQDGWELLTGNLRCNAAATPGSDFTADPRAGLRIVTSVFREWHVRTVADKDARAGDRTESSLILLHDLLSLRKDMALLGSPLVPDPWRLDWAVAQWRSGPLTAVSIGWPLPDWWSFWEYDLFQALWQMVQRFARETPDVPARASVDALVYWWMTLSLEVVRGTVDAEIQRSASNRDKVYPSQEDWARLGRDVAKLLSLMRDESRRPFGRREMSWLIAVLSMLSPEAGLPWLGRGSEGPRSILPDPSMLPLSVQNSIRYRRARWLGRFLHLESNAHARSLFCIWTAELLSAVLTKLENSEPRLRENLASARERLEQLKGKAKPPSRLGRGETPQSSQEVRGRRRGRPRSKFPGPMPSHPNLRSQVCLILDGPISEEDFESRLTPAEAESILELLLHCSDGLLAGLPPASLEFAIDCTRHFMNTSGALLPGSMELPVADQEIDAPDSQVPADKAPPFRVETDWHALRDRILLG